MADVDACECAHVCVCVYVCTAQCVCLGCAMELIERTRLQSPVYLRADG